ncbi:hypothetical protein [Kallotenue papyrolyticum]|uniref:hypothetical protein n=1 Tax=Kallotenue papyrolyticum TaxID=1325125 RepID=UPI0004785C14|nr:hypothetical protein [Kallotenue papyrolyticum]
MAYLSYPSATDLHLRLEGHEQAILTVVRKCPWWHSAEVEGRRPGSTTVSAVTLIARRDMDPTLRQILATCAGLVFPADGGAGRPRARPRRAGPASKRKQR